jgi:hypothetical protein
MYLLFNLVETIIESTTSTSTKHIITFLKNELSKRIEVQLKFVKTRNQVAVIFSLSRMHENFSKLRFVGGGGGLKLSRYIVLKR